MQYTRLTTLLFFVAFFGLVAIAAPVPTVGELQERCAFGCNDGSVVTILTNLQVTVKADVAVVANLVAEASVDLTLYAAAFATLVADIQAAVTLVAALPVSVVGLSVGLIASTVATIFIDIFVVINSCSAIPNITSCYSELDGVLVALLAGLKLALGDLVIGLIATLCVVIKAVLSLSINVNIFANLSAVLFV